MTIFRTQESDPRFRLMVEALDAYLAMRNGDRAEFFKTLNHAVRLRYVVVAIEGQTPIGCGAIKQLEPHVFEIKRMYVRPESRGAGVADAILNELISWIGELGGTQAVLETGADMIAPLKFYGRMGFRTIPNYGVYAGIDDSVCMGRPIEI